MNTEEILRTIELLERSEDKMLVAFDLNGATHKVPNPMTAEEARVAVSTAVGLGATRISISRFEN